MEIIAITTAADPALRDFKERKDALVRQQGNLLADSDKVVLRALQRGLPCRKLLATAAFAAELRATYGDCLSCPVYVATREVMEGIVGHRLHHGVVGVFERPKDTPMAAWGQRVVLCNGVNNSENTGAIARSIHALGFKTLVCDDKSCSPFVRRAVRVSMGSVFAIGIAHCHDLCETLEHMRQQGYTIVAADAGPAAAPLKSLGTTAAAAGPVALVLGAEATGVEAAVLALCHHRVKIPIVPDIDSLNVAVASGILLHHWGEV